MLAATKIGTFTTIPSHAEVSLTWDYLDRRSVMVLTELQPDLVPLLNVLQVTGDEIVESSDEVALLVRWALCAVPVLRRLRLDSNAQSMFEEEFRYDRIVAQVDAVLRGTYS